MSFKELIDHEIKGYQERHPLNAKLQKNEWAFNYWVLDKLFYEEEEIIEGKIIDYRDYGVDCYEIYEDTKEIFLIQNKYYSETTQLSADYVKNDFLTRAITMLENGTYTKSQELQDAFTKYKADDELTVYLQLYVTNNKHSVEADEYIKTFNLAHPRYRASIFYLDDIAKKYYDESPKTRKTFTATIESVNNGTVLNINNEAYKLKNIIDAKYVFAPIVSVYYMYDKAKKENYPIFEENIREYLGNKGANKYIYDTLLDETDRKNFFYYNNGITIICDEMKKPTTRNRRDSDLNYRIEIVNPQIVNGCQTVSTIYEVLKNVHPDKLEKEFKDTFVMAKILQIDHNDEAQQVLYKSIVRYNNSQTKIDEKAFTANTNLFIRLQNEFENRGFLLLVKQSDKNKFTNKYRSPSQLNELSQNRIKRFGLSRRNTAPDYFIDLVKFLQVINAFVSGGQVAYRKKINMLKDGSAENNSAIDFIKNLNSIDALLDLYLLYLKAEETKKQNSIQSPDDPTPIPYYLIDCFAKYECKERNPKLIEAQLDKAENIQGIIELYTMVCAAYTTEYKEEHNISYNNMIKNSIEYGIIAKQRNVAKQFIEMQNRIKSSTGN